MQRKPLKRTANFSSKVICDQVRTLSLFCDQQILHYMESILKDPEHALFGELERLPHGPRFISLAHNTNSRGSSFVPIAVRLDPQQGMISHLNQS